jgi:hypothetical protein
MKFSSFNFYSKYLLVYFSLFPTLFLKSQVNDAGLWLSATVEKKINSRFSASFNPALRFNENVTEIGTAFADAGLEYKLNKRIKLSVNYRFISRRKIDNSYGLRHRFYFDFTYRKKIQRFVATYRLRLLEQYTEIYSRETGKIPDYAIRNKLQLRYETDTKYTPFISGELWYSIDYKENLFNQFRLVGGIEYEINKFSSVTLSYIFQKEFNTEDPWTNYITSIGYSFSF